MFRAEVQNDLLFAGVPVELIAAVYSRINEGQKPLCLHFSRLEIGEQAHEFQAAFETLFDHRRCTALVPVFLMVSQCGDLTLPL